VLGAGRKDFFGFKHTLAVYERGLKVFPMALGGNDWVSYSDIPNNLARECLEYIG
jgi:hypothetical protein